MRRPTGTGPAGCQGLSGQLCGNTAPKDMQQEHEFGLSLRSLLSDIELKGLRHCLCDMDTGQETP